MQNISLWIFFGLLAYMPLHIFLSTWVGTSFYVLDFAKVAKDIVLIMGFLAVLIPSLRRPGFKELLRDKLLWLIGGYALLTLLLAAIKPTDVDAEVLGVVYNLRFLLFFCYGLLLTQFYQADWLRRTALRVVLVVALPVLLFGVVQYLWLPDAALTHVGYTRENGVLPSFHIDDKPDLERVMSTLRDPNSFGSYIIIIFAITVSYLLYTKNKYLKRTMLGMSMLSVLCLYLTFSRGAWIGVVVSSVVIAALHFRGKRRFKLGKWPIIAAVALVMLASGLFVARDTYFVRNVIFHADESTILEDPNQLRLRFWEESLEATLRQPLGHGPGTAGLASIRNDMQGTVLNENYYLQILYEVGVFGLLIFLGILYVVAVRLYRQSLNHPATIALLASFVGLLVTNLLVHIWANEAVAYTWWGLAGLVIFTKASKKAIKTK